MTSEQLKEPPAPRRKLGYQHAGIIGKLTYSFVGPLLSLGARGAIDERTADAFLPDADHADVLSAAFEGAYAAEVSRASKLSISPAGRVWRAYWRLYKWRLLEHLSWSVIEVGVRVGSPLLLRQLLAWFTLNSLYGTAAAPTWQGWMWSGLLAGFSYSYVLVHHQLFWRGMRMGMEMRLQAIAAVEAKALRLNATAVSDVTGGRIVNVVSNDVRRFDEAGTFWPFLITGPLELIIVLVLVGTRLGYAASVAGVSTLLLLIPTQSALARYIGHLRAATARETDERVRLTGEAISGILACKMLAWEDPLMEQLRSIRTREARYIGKMNMIRAINMATSYAITPLVSLITFATARGTGAQLTVANVFYALALLSLPKLYMCEFFVHGVECISELRVSIRRLADFLVTPEPPQIPSIKDEAGPVIVVRQADFDWGSIGVESPGKGGTETEFKGVEVHRVALSIVEPEEPVDHPVVKPATATLPGFSLSVRQGELLAIVGPVGAGKSSILSVILGELQPRKDLSAQEIVQSVRPVAYSQQIPWIKSGSVRENVLFGLPFDESRYAAVLDACALRHDLATMSAGDATEIGERGISISGGQKARLSLARAAYSGAKVMLLDDPLSAVDPRVGRHLFHKCIKGLMEGATRVLVTHQRQYLPYCDRIIVVRGGRVMAQGSFSELVASKVPEVVASEADAITEGKEFVFDEMVGHHDELQDAAAAEPSEDEVRESSQSDENPTDAVPPMLAISSAPRPVRFESTLRVLNSLPSIKPGIKAFDSNFLRSSSGSLRRAISSVGLGLPGRRRKETDGHVQTGDEATLESGKLIVKEDRAEGSVTWRVYWQLMQRMGLIKIACIAAGLLGGQAAYLLGDYWIALWSGQDPVTQQEARWVWVYAIFATSILVVSLSRAVLFFWSALQAATALHDDAARRLLHAPLSFFHTNPTGRVLNRFSKDQGAIDEQLPVVLFDTLQALMMVIGAFLLLVIVVPFILPIFVPLGLAFFWVQRRYLKTSRELKRFEAVTRSPLYAAFSATLKGLPTIHAYAAEERFRTEFLQLLTDNGAWWFSWLTTARWIGFRLDLLVAILLTAAPLLMMAIHDRLSPRLVGLALTQSLYLAGMLQWMVRQAAEVENNMTSAERLLTYCQLDQEPPTVAGGAALPPNGWPAGGELEYDDVTAIYRPGLPPVLCNVSFKLPGGCAAGVVGRTGSGKSSLMLTLFRLIPLTGGRIVLDGVDTAGIGLDSLRRQIAIIPQDPVLFSGTLRSNLDPWGRFEDGMLWEALGTAALRDVVVTLGGLDARLNESGDNLSAGQRQLLCLARALLQDAAILALDEATANVDRNTDALIQVAVRRACAGEGGTRFGARRRTLLVIAHRIDTILDCDRLLVLERGELVEQGSPQELIALGGIFAGMTKAANLNTFTISASRK